MEVVVTNTDGLHLRNAATLVSAASKFQNAELMIDKDGHEVNGKSIMGVLTLMAEYQTKLRLRARGQDAEQLLEKLAGLFENGFDTLEG